jgi:hypothetical protein
MLFHERPNVSPSASIMPWRASCCYDVPYVLERSQMSSRIEAVTLLPNSRPPPPSKSLVSG